MKPSQFKQLQELRDEHVKIAENSAGIATKVIKMNGEVRTMKCPCCKCLAISQDVESPYICTNCGWDSSKKNGEPDER